MKDESRIYLDTYILQQDMRIRLPKGIIKNFNAKRGETLFDIYMNSEATQIILEISDKKKEKSINDK